jgi:hypothetical protein
VGLGAGDPDVVVLSRLTIAFASLVSRDRGGAISVMDEVMLAVSSQETSDAVVGLAYCSAIDACVMLREGGPDCTSSPDLPDRLRLDADRRGRPRQQPGGRAHRRSDLTRPTP